MTKKSAHPELAHWLREQQNAQREIDQATEDAARWLERARLAQRAGNQELVDAAKAKMTEVRATHQQAKTRLQNAENALAQLRAEPQSLDDKEARFAQELLLSFELMGIDPDATALEDALANEEIQQRIQDMKRDANIEEPVDALALLKARMNERPDSDA